MNIDNEFHCICGMPEIETPSFPKPHTPEWHIMHAKVHWATFVGLAFKVTDTFVSTLS